MKEHDQQQATTTFSDKDIDLLKRTILRGFPPDDQAFFIRMCERQGIDPFRKPPLIYPVGRKDKNHPERPPVLVPVTSIGYLTAQAIATGHYNGCQISWADKDGQWLNEWLNEREHPLAARAIVHHKARDYPEVGIARWKSYAQPNSSFWIKMDDLMLAKCAKALAIRGAFPDLGMYISEELGADIDEGMMDQEKIADSQRRDKELKASGVKFVESRGTQPTPAQALEPAFPEDEPPKAAPAFGKRLVEEQKEAEAAAPAPGQDDIDMSPQVDDHDASKQWWFGHIIKGLPNAKDYQGKTVGELSEIQIKKIAEKWIPAYKEQHAKATPEQTADYKAFEARIEFDNHAKPW
jgi:RecT family